MFTKANHVCTLRGSYISVILCGPAEPLSRISTDINKWKYQQVTVVTT